MGSLTPLTVTTKLPLPGFSLLTSTFAFEPTPLTIFSERVRNAPQDLQASIDTILPPLVAGENDASTAASAAADDSTLFALEEAAGFFVSLGLVIAGAAFAGGSSLDLREDEAFDADDRVTLAMTFLCDGCSFNYWLTLLCEEKLSTGTNRRVPTYYYFAQTVVLYSSTCRERK